MDGNEEPRLECNAPLLCGAVLLIVLHLARQVPPSHACISLQPQPVALLSAPRATSALLKLPVKTIDFVETTVRLYVCMGD